MKKLSYFKINGLYGIRYKNIDVVPPCHVNKIDALKELQYFINLDLKENFIHNDVKMTESEVELLNKFMEKYE